MRRFLIIGLLLIQIPFFILVSRSIVNVTILQLRYQLTRERLLNYELSSRVLETRFRKQLASRDDVSNEIKMNVLESSILNFDTKSEQMELTPTQVMGLWIVNFVRALSLKSLLSLEDDQEKLLMLQYAFYLERNRRYDAAAKKYLELEPLLDTGKNDDQGFVLLHGGYSLAMLGKTKEGITELEKVIDLYDGTHYSKTAILLLNLLREGEHRKEKIEKAYSNEKDRAEAFFNAGQYAEAVKRFENVENLQTEDKYILSRSYEETGRIKNAVDGYVEIVKKADDQDLAKEANRRLLMIGNFYGGGKEMSKFAEQNAKKLGDEELVEEVKDGVELQLKPVVIEKIAARAREESQEDTGVDAKKLEEIRDELETSLDIQSESIEIIKEDVKKEAELEIKKEEPVIVVSKPVPQYGPAPRLYIEFVDGRKIYSQRLIWEEGSVVLKSGEYNITLPVTMVGDVSMDEGSGDTKHYEMHFKLGNGKIIKGIELKKEGGNFIIISRGAGQVEVSLDDIKETNVRLKK